VLSLDPVIGAISAGNAVVLKPSEISPATSLVLSNLVEEYLDDSAIRVVEGAVDETTALLEQKWDKILYTGFFSLLLVFIIAFDILRLEHL
jgi:aldehyde dehydrogenase (NAD+)